MEATDVEGVLRKHKQDCKSSVEAFQRELQKVRTGRASTGLIENLQVEYYGSRTPLGHLGQLSAPEARLIIIQPYDPKACPAIEKAIQASSLGLNPARDGNMIRISIPPLTQETRKEIVKSLHKMAEDIRVSVRNHRRDSNDVLKKLEKDGTVNKDDSKRGLERIQKQTDSYIEDIDKILQAKETECLEV